ncbi:DinB family protein [Paenibacillus sinopodophylli]|uniref:DinB family protein n=1 Tax=Paenibacillus sinopodophylli TaxID=1837342 RepID=UPI00110D100B|nr:DinB family protein [Paenibacillus sinopodophylli]
MSYAFNREWLLHKFEEIRRRLLKAINQLDDEQLNWQPDVTSHSISVLIKHMDGNITERIRNGILQWEIEGGRTAELQQAFTSKAELIEVIQAGFELIIHTIRDASDERLEMTQQVRSRKRSNLDMLHQCAAHYSEHMGQVFYIAKLCLKDTYKSTSV